MSYLLAKPRGRLHGAPPVADRVERGAWGLALVLAVVPLWASVDLPLVDLPQHLHLISALHRLDDPSTLFPQFLERRPELTPYLGYYYVVSLLHWLMPLDAANRVFLSLVIAGLPLSLAFLLRSLRRPAWPALLAIPFGYGDSLGWGFINFCSAVPLAFLTCGLFVRAIEDAPRRKAWAAGLAVSLVAVLLFHVQLFAYLGLALPWLLGTTPAPEGKGWRPRAAALVGVAPGVALFLGWVALRLGQPAEIAPGQPWKSWGPLLSPQNLAWKSFEQNRAELVPLLGNLLPGGEDLRAVQLALGLAGAAVVLALVTGRDPQEGPVARWRIVGLAAIAAFGFFALPFDIRGYMYYLNTRYVHVLAPLAVACVPALKPRFLAKAPWAGVLVGLATCIPLAKGFRAFDAEAAQLRALAAWVRPAPRVMGLIYATGSAHRTHPVFLHSAATLARLQGGLTNFSFALTPHSPLRYQSTPPPTFPSEWRPDQMRWEEHGRAYDTFVLRGAHPAQVFGSRLDGELEVAAQAGDFYLVRRRQGP